MSGFEKLAGAVEPSTLLAMPAAEDVAFEGEQLDDATALSMVLADASIAEKFLQSKGRPQEWNTLDELYRASVKIDKWPNGQPKAHLSMPVVMEVVEMILPQSHLAFFSDKQPFLLTAKGKTTQAAARAAAKVLVWAIKCAGFKEEIRKMLKSCLLYGFCVGKWGWRSGTKPQKVYKRGAEGIESHTTDVDMSEPTFDYVDLRNVLVDPALRSHDIRNSRYVIQQSFITAEDLDELREEFDNIPSRDALRKILAAKEEPTTDSLRGSKEQPSRDLQAEQQGVETSIDPLKQPLELLEYWTKDRVIVVLQRKIVLRNEENEFDCLPFVSCSFIDVLGAAYGFGIGKLLEGEQKFQIGTINAWVNSLSLVMSPAFHRKKGLTPGSQTIQIGPGTVVNDDGDLTPLPIQNITDQAMLAVQSSEARSRRRVGANFGSDMPTQAMRTAEGVHEFTAGLQVKLQYFVENFSDLVFLPALESFICMAKDRLTPDEINAILTEEDGKAFEGEILEVYNGYYGLEALSSTKLAARRAMAAMLPMLMQLVSAQPVQDSLALQGKKIDYAELVNQMLDLSGWDAPGIVVDMSPADQQRAAMSNPAMMKMMAEKQKMDQQQQNTLEQIEATATGRAGVQVVRHILDESKAPEPQAPLPTREGGR